MLPSGQRLRRSADFAATIRSGRRAGRGAIVVHLSRRGAAEASGAVRAGFVIPRAVGSAVIRNRVRRRLRQLVRDQLTELPPPTDLVIRVLPDAGARSYGQLGQDLSAAIAAAQAARPRRHKKGAPA